MLFFCSGNVASLSTLDAKMVDQNKEMISFVIFSVDTIKELG